MIRIRYSVLLLPLALLAAGCTQSTDTPVVDAPATGGVNTVSLHIPDMT